ncbi:TetR/AcrR family transcriptional regulator [Microbacterium sp. M28]|uniref:TetR/AcrR family transcriptional regulator n=1 Tax=Microbacterium sp. M28 TaxID=2962064 RepID=UPI0021F46047|nr:TetR/AcrR family transcriptional regulator [Microbacterium sp. M28]UYO98060.1 TetR/AcrR family transcriptional regulator [Microbacterium sp. M28]
MTNSTPRPLRADAERSVHAILEAAERVLSADPNAPMEKIALAAGVARTTIHRRFDSRLALIDALALSAAERLAHAIDDGRPDTAPPLVALHRITANVLEVKGAWAFALGVPAEAGSAAAELHDDIARLCLVVLERAQAAGVLDESTDLLWARSVYYGLLSATLQSPPEDAELDVDALASRIVDTLLHGVSRSE